MRGGRLGGEGRLGGGGVVGGVREGAAPAGDFGERVDFPDGLLGAVSHESLQGGIPLACQRLGQLLTILLECSHHLHHYKICLF